MIIENYFDFSVVGDDNAISVVIIDVSPDIIFVAFDQIPVVFKMEIIFSISLESFNSILQPDTIVYLPRTLEQQSIIRVYWCIL